ncbi:MAG: hypothetical protein HY514_01680 [Candidatus Aenigmarchaeota archaeon]|nr:hypothetical protein [Candidatus Aenigmarchaeota archaeon]
MSKRSKKIHKTVFTTLLVGSSLFVGSAIGDIVYRIKQSIDNTAQVEPYLRAHKNEIEKEVERKFSIALEGVALTFTDNLYSPMRYDPNQDVIIVGKNKWYAFLKRSNSFDPFKTVFTQSTLVGTYIHELGHDYFYQIRKHLLSQGKIAPDKYMGYSILKVTIREGIADYFAVESGENRAGFFNAKEIDTVEKIYAQEKRYEYGRRIVKPILDQLGAEQGITQILLQPEITEPELFRPALFQQRILRSYNH